MIITSVVPPELPMIMNISINYSLMYLRKKKIFCTEPGRIPLAGRIHVCAFDKTGTLTTDKLVIKGVVQDLSVDIDCTENNSGFNKCSNATNAILSGCHTLVVHGGELLGDPIERLFFENTDFKYNNSSKSCTLYRSQMLTFLQPNLPTIPRKVPRKYKSRRFSSSEVLSRE
jgi:cation-transporting ATPase 13A1